MKKILFMIISILDYIIPKNDKKIVYTSFPDLSDNSFAMFIYMSNNNSKFKSIWLVDNMEKTNLYKKMVSNYSKNNNYQIIKKNSLLGIYHYLTSKYIFFTHGLYTGVIIPDKHIVVNLWHGMPLKKIANLDQNLKGLIPNTRYTIATSQIYKDIMMKAFNLTKDKVRITGQPRNDLLFDNKDILKNFNINSTIDKVFMWMPTYRKSIYGDIRQDANLDGLPLLTISELQEVNQILKTINSILIIKLHPMDILTQYSFIEYSNIKIMKNEDFEEKGLQLYSLLGAVDVLVTDYSSVYIDFMLTNKPIAFTIDDIDSFKNSRGFIFENPLDYLKGIMIKDKIQFQDFLKNIKIIDYTKLNNKLNVKKDSYSKTVFENFIGQ